MTAGILKQSPSKFLSVVAGLTALAILATALVGYFITSSPRGFMVWVTVGFLCLIEFLVGILSVNILTKARSQYRPSGATLAITYGIVGLFAASGVASIAIYWSVRDASGTKDGAFIAILMGIMVFWFIAAALIYAYDLHAQAITQPVTEKRIEHRDYARSLNPILLAVRSVRTDDNEIRNRLSTLTKRLEMITVALAHSHGGGLGSREAGRSHPVAPDQDQVIQDGIGMMGGILPRLYRGTSGDMASALSEFEQCVTSVSSAVNSLGLQ